MSAADLVTRIDAARGDHQRANDLIAEARDRYKPPEPPPPPPNEGIDIGSIAHTALDLAGFIPVVGVVADLAHAAWYAAEGDYVNAGLTAAAAVPFVGDAAAATKLATTAAVGLAGAAAAARNADNARDAAIGMARAAQIRQQFRIGKKNNVAFADVNLAGIDNYTFLPAASGKHSPKGTVGLPDNPVFKTITSSRGFRRDRDSEYKILENIAARVTNSPNPRGTVNLFTEKPPCIPSCQSVIRQFKDKFPNIELRVTHGNRRD